MESLGLAGMFTCLPPVRGGTVQIPEYTAGTRQKGTAVRHFNCLLSKAPYVPQFVCLLCGYSGSSTTVQPGD